MAPTKPSTLVLSFVSALADAPTAQGELLLLWRPSDLERALDRRRPLTMMAMAVLEPAKEQPKNAPPLPPRDTPEELARRSIATATRLVTKDDLILVRKVCRATSAALTPQGKPIQYAKDTIIQAFCWRLGPANEDLLRQNSIELDVRLGHHSWIPLAHVLANGIDNGLVSTAFHSVVLPPAFERDLRHIATADDASPRHIAVLVLAAFFRVRLRLDAALTTRLSKSARAAPRSKASPQAATTRPASSRCSSTPSVTSFAPPSPSPCSTAPSSRCRVRSTPSAERSRTQSWTSRRSKDCAAKRCRSSTCALQGPLTSQTRTAAPGRCPTAAERRSTPLRARSVAGRRSLDAPRRLRAHRYAVGPQRARRRGPSCALAAVVQRRRSRSASASAPSHRCGRAAHHLGRPRARPRARR